MIKRAKGATSTSIGRSRFAEPETIRLTKMPGLIPSRLRQRRRRVTRSGTSSSSAALDPAPHVLKRTKRPGDKKSCVAVEVKSVVWKVGQSRTTLGFPKNDDHHSSIWPPRSAFLSSLKHGRELSCFFSMPMARQPPTSHVDFGADGDTERAR